MPFVMNMGNDRMNRVKILQQEKQRNQQIRKTGNTGVVSLQKNANPTNIQRLGQPNQTLQYTQCPYCKQQILTSTLQHHISYCQSAYKPRTKGNCTACEQFRKK